MVHKYFSNSLLVFRIFSILVLAVAWVGFFNSPVEASATFTRAPYSGLKLPFACGTSVQVSGDSATHNWNDSHSYERHAVDFAVTKVNVMAMKGGVVARTGYDTNGGNFIIIDHKDGFYATYLHLNEIKVKLNTNVSQGQLIAVSGNTGNGVYHLHVSVSKKTSAGFTTATGNEYPMYFNELSSRELRAGDTIKSSNCTSTPPTTTLVLPTVFKNGSSSIWFDRNYDRLNVRVCASNLSGNTIYLRVDRQGRTWEINKKATTGCLTFYDVEGPGPALRKTTYTTRLAMNQKPKTSWPIPCAKATNYAGLCDTIRRP